MTLRTDGPGAVGAHALKDVLRERGGDKALTGTVAVLYAGQLQAGKAQQADRNQHDRDQHLDQAKPD